MLPSMMGTRNPAQTTRAERAGRLQAILRAVENPSWSVALKEPALARFIQATVMVSLDTAKDYADTLLFGGFVEPHADGHLVLTARGRDYAGLPNGGAA